MRHVLVLFVISASLWCSLAQSETSPDLGVDLQPMNLRKFTEAEAAVSGARCLDGSPSGYYFMKGAEKNSTKWLFFLDFGGFCHDEGTCRSRTFTAFGSSNYWQPSISAGFNLVCSDPVQNPDFYSWNLVRIPYCSGDFHTGQRKEASNTTYGLYFAGHLTVAAVIDDLLANHDMFRATDVVVTGTSAGGYGVFMNIDYFTQRVKGARVVGLPQSGFFLWPMSYGHWVEKLDSDEELLAMSQQGSFEKKQGSVLATNNKKQTKTKLRGTQSKSAGHSDLEYSPPQCRQSTTVENINLEFLFNLYHSYVPPTCLDNYPDNYDHPKCLSPQIAYKYIQSEMFISQNLYDSDQIFRDLGAPNLTLPITGTLKSYIGYFGVCMKGMRDLVIDIKKDGYFMPSCLAHVLNLRGPRAIHLHGQNMQETFGVWYFNKPQGHKSMTDFCDGIICNPTCQHPDHANLNDESPMLTEMDYGRWGV